MAELTLELTCIGSFTFTSVSNSTETGGWATV